MWRWWEKIKELILRTVFDVPVAKEICRRAGLPWSSGGTLDFLTALWWSAPWYNYPEYLGTSGPYAPDPLVRYSLRKIAPKKASDADEDYVWGDDFTYFDFIPIATYEVFRYRPNRWGDGMEYRPGSNFTGPRWGSWFHPFVASVPNAGWRWYSPGDPEEFDSVTPNFVYDALLLSNFIWDNHPYVTGSTTYDPYPYPEYPMYFWGDFKHMEYIWILSASSNSNNLFTTNSYFGIPAQLAPPDMWPAKPRVDTTKPVEDFARGMNYNPLTQPINLYLRASLDNGATWDTPFGVRVGDGEFQDRDFPLNLIGSSAISGYRIGGGQLKPEYRRDGVKLKFVLQTQSVEDRIYVSEITVKTQPDSTPF